jgi:hypothetical protein
MAGLTDEERMNLNEFLDQRDARKARESGVASEQIHLIAADWKQRRPRSFRFLSIVAVSIFLVFYGITHGGEFAEGIKRIKEFIWPPPSALDVYSTAAKDSFSRDMLSRGLRRVTAQPP